MNLAARRAAALLLTAAALSGCEAAGGIVGGVSGVATGIATGNAALGYAVGVGIRAAANATIQYVQRNMRRGEQDVIAATAGVLMPGQVAAWKIERALPFGYGDAQGTVQVVRLIESPLAECREVAVTVGEEKERTTLIATACHQDGGWKWASAEPAVERWGALQ